MSKIAHRSPRTTTFSLHTVRTLHDDSDRPCFRRKTGFIYSLNAAFCCKGSNKLAVNGGAQSAPQLHSVPQRL